VAGGRGTKAPAKGARLLLHAVVELHDLDELLLGGRAGVRALLRQRPGGQRQPRALTPPSRRPVHFISWQFPV
jgi:hypothetical protein